MKKYIYIILIMTFPLLGKAQHHTPDSLLVVGQWGVNYDQTVALMEGRQQEQYDSLNVVFKQRLRTNISGQTFTFLPDKRFEARTGSGDLYEGKWKIKPNQQLLTLNYDNGAKSDNDLISLESDHMVIRIAPNNSNQLFHFLYLDLISR